MTKCIEPIYIKVPLMAEGDNPPYLLLVISKNVPTLAGYGGMTISRDSNFKTSLKLHNNLVPCIKFQLYNVIEYVEVNNRQSINGYSKSTKTHIFFFCETGCQFSCSLKSSHSQLCPLL